jgi:pimeloyl-ACP methyl ester carboxylesterase
MIAMMQIDIGGRAIEYRVIPGPVSERPPLVFLHEGLGCAALWRDFPDKVARDIGVPALVYSRFGYGHSAGLERPRTPRYLHEEALDVLPALLDRLGIAQPLLIGHSDGASIALIHAASGARPVAGIVAMAPHVMVEPMGVEAIARIAEMYAQGPLRTRLARYHARVDDAFYGWANIWRDPAFRDWRLDDEARALSIPALLIQGVDDEYGTLAQIDRIEQLAKGPVERLMLDPCGHSPHRDQEAAVLAAIVSFAGRLQATATE